MRTSNRAPMKASKMRPEHLNLRDGEPPMAVCPDCNTWHRLKRSMILPHRAHTTRPRPTTRRYRDEHTPPPSTGPRCPGSAQRIEIDLTREQWSQALLTADSTATQIRAARQHFKPVPAPAAPVTHMTPDRVSAEDARAAYATHFKVCRGSGISGCCQGSYRCAEGARLAVLYERLLRTQPMRDRTQRDRAAVQARMDRRAAAAAAADRKAEWQRQQPAASSTTAKRSGTAIEDANNLRRFHPAHAVSGSRGPQLPLRTTT